MRFVDPISTLSLGLAVMALIWGASAFHTLPSRNALNMHLPQNRVITCSAVDAGNALYNAAYAGNCDKMKTLITQYEGNSKVLNWENPERYGRTPLIIASYYGKLEAVKLLLATPGVDPNKGSDFGATPLHFAAHRGHVSVVNALLADRRIKINVKATGGKWTGKTPLDTVFGMGMSGKPEIAEALKAKGAK